MYGAERRLRTSQATNRSSRGVELSHRGRPKVRSCVYLSSNGVLANSVTLKPRTLIGNISVQQFSQCGLLDGRAKSVLEAIISGHDLFQFTAKQQTSTLLAENEKAKSTILSNIEELNDQSAKQQETTHEEIIRLTVTIEGRLNELKEDMEKKHMELKELLLNAKRIHNTKRRQSLQGKEQGHLGSSGSL